MSESDTGFRTGGKTGRNPRVERKLPPIQARVYALRPYTVKVEDGKFFIAPTIAFQNKLEWKGPYASLRHATAAIARKLEAEFVARDKRLVGEKARAS